MFLRKKKKQTNKHTLYTYIYTFTYVFYIDIRPPSYFLPSVFYFLVCFFFCVVYLCVVNPQAFHPLIYNMYVRYFGRWNQNHPTPFPQQKLSFRRKRTFFFFFGICCSLMFWMRMKMIHIKRTTVGIYKSRCHSYYALMKVRQTFFFFFILVFVGFCLVFFLHFFSIYCVLAIPKTKQN